MSSLSIAPNRGERIKKQTRKTVPFKSKLTKLELTENSILNNKTADAERTEAKNIASESFASVLMPYFIRAL